MIVFTIKALIYIYTHTLIHSTGNVERFKTSKQVENIVMGSQDDLFRLSRGNSNADVIRTANKTQT
jgi:hypothetical protein